MMGSQKRIDRFHSDSPQKTGGSRFPLDRSAKLGHNSPPLLSLALAPCSPQNASRRWDPAPNSQITEV